MEPHREGSEKQEQQELAKVEGSPFQSIDSMKAQTVHKSA